MYVVHLLYKKKCNERCAILTMHVVVNTMYMGLTHTPHVTYYRHKTVSLRFLEWVMLHPPYFRGKVYIIVYTPTTCMYTYITIYVLYV